MKFKSTSGKEYKIDIRPSKWPKRSFDDCKSNIQWSVSCFLSELFSCDVILEEFFVPGDKLFLDFFLPRLRVAVEVHGEQHFVFNKFFHKTKFDFLKSKERDSRKEKWCEINNIKLIIIRFDDSKEDIKEKLKAI